LHGQLIFLRTQLLIKTCSDAIWRVNETYTFTYKLMNILTIYRRNFAIFSTHTKR